MRKLLFPLLCLSLIFNSCEEDDSTTSPPDAEAYSSLSATNGEMTITSIDPTTNTIDGNFSVTVYHLTEPTMPSVLLNGSFSDIPLL